MEFVQEFVQISRIGTDNNLNIILFVCMDRSYDKHKCVL